MKISVITVSYNAEDCIERTIRSVLGQTWNDLEYIVIDGGSKDRTPEIISKYAGRLAYWCSERDGGIYFGMNKGIAAATGDYALFLNADDTFVEEKVVERIARFLESTASAECAAYPKYAANAESTARPVDTTGAECPAGTDGAACADGTSPADVAYGDFYYEYDYGSYLRHPKPIEKMACSMAVCHQATLVRTTLLKQRPFDTKYRLSADFDMLSDLYLQGKKFVYMPFPVANMVMGSGMTHEHEAKSVAEFQAIMASHGQPLSAGQKGLLGRKKFIEWLKKVLPDKIRRPLFRFIAKIYKPL